MSELIVEIPWGKSKISLQLPSNWTLSGVVQPGGPEKVADTAVEVKRSLKDPIGMPHLAELAKNATRIVVVIDDISRPTPVKEIFPEVAAELKAAGVKEAHVTVIPALGLHRPMPENEIRERIGVGEEVPFCYENPDCDDPLKLTLLGTTSQGSPVWVNKTVAEADLVISIGCIEPHIIASFGGGYKNLFPGVAGRAWVASNHSLNCKPGTFNMVGQPIEKNPMRQDLEESGKMLKGKVFIVNAVLNASMQVVKIVSGDAILAHRAGTEVSAQIYGVKVPEFADVVITDSFPMDSDLRQGVKALANTIRALKPGGVMVTLVRADEGVGVFGLANKKLPLSKGALRFLAPVLLPLVPKIKLSGMGEEDKFFLYFALQAMRRGTLLMYAPTIPDNVKSNLPFVDFVDSPEAAIEIARQRFPKTASVLVFPHGGSTYPILPA